MNKTEQILQNSRDSDFSGGPVVNNPPANAGDTGSIPGLGRSHMSWVKEAHAPQLLSLCLATREATTMRSAGITSRESPRAAQP